MNEVMHGYMQVLLALDLELSAEVDTNMQLTMISEDICELLCMCKHAPASMSTTVCGRMGCTNSYPFCFFVYHMTVRSLWALATL